MMVSVLGAIRASLLGSVKNRKYGCQQDQGSTSNAVEQTAQHIVSSFAIKERYLVLLGKADDFKSSRIAAYHTWKHPVLLRLC